jgi:hypothetical protein
MKALFKKVYVGRNAAGLGQGSQGVWTGVYDKAFFRFGGGCMGFALCFPCEGGGLWVVFIYCFAVVVPLGLLDGRVLVFNVFLLFIIQI